MKKTLFAITAVILSLTLLTSCNLFGNIMDSTAANTEPPAPPVIVTDDSGNAQTDEQGSVITETLPPETQPAVPAYDFSFSAKDLSGESGAPTATVQFGKDSVSVEGSGAAAVGTALTVTEAGVYSISGNCDAGSITVNAPADAKVHLVLSGLSLRNPKGPAIFVKSADKVYVTSSAGSENVISDGEQYVATDAGTNLDAAIFSRSDLTVNGSGKLTVNGLMAHGIVSKDDLVIAGCTLKVKAIKSGLCGKDCVKIASGNIEIDAGSDGIKSDNSKDAGRGFIYVLDGSITVNSGKEGLQAETMLRIDGGSITILSAGVPMKYAQTERKGGSVTANGLAK